MNTTRYALELDRILTNPTALAAVQEAIATRVPIHERDQADAAHRDMTTLTRAVGTLMGDTREAWHDFGDAPEWLRIDLLTRIAGFLDGTIDTCVHSPHPHQMRPVFAAACKPNLVTCGFCQHMLTLPRGSAADAACDCCGHICLGPDADDGIYPGLTRMGLMIFTYDTCRDCRPQIPNGAAP